MVKSLHVIAPSITNPPIKETPPPVSAKWRKKKHDVSTSSVEDAPTDKSKKRKYMTVEELVELAEQKKKEKEKRKKTIDKPSQA